MYLEQFLYLKTISETSSLRLAGELLSVTEQALSLSIRKLERELGTTLIHRTNKGVSLTPEGEYLVQKSQIILSAVKDIQQHFSCLQQEKATLSVLAQPYVIEQILSPVVLHYNREISNVSLSLQVADLSEILLQLRHGGMDAGVISPFLINQELSFHLDPQLKYDEIFSFPMFIAVSPQCPLAEKKELTYEELYQYPYIVRLTGSERDDYFSRRAAQYPNSKLLYANNSDVARELLLQNRGWLLSPYTEESRQLENSGKIVNCSLKDIALRVSVGLLYSCQHPNRGLLKDFLQNLKAYCVPSSINRI